MKENIIYGLLDPRNDLCYYVGKSTVGLNRPLTHLVNSHSKDVNEWVNELKEMCLFPKIVIFEKCRDLNDLVDLEIKHIIEQSKINDRLFNKQHKLKDYEHLKSVTELIKDFNNIGITLKKHRKRLKVCQTELSKQTKLSRSAITNIENGINTKTSSVLKILNYLKSKE